MYALAPEIAQVETEYGLVLLDQAKGKYFNLNPSGLIVLREMLRSGDENDAVAALTAEFAVDENIATEDVRGVVEALVGAGILVRATEPAG
ncbi:MAG TPA: lasso peptide biosynthesis PqqD family chaperone [Kribbellaceae bacterium]|jgi:hypothetical protein